MKFLGLLGGGAEEKRRGGLGVTYGGGGSSKIFMDQSDKKNANKTIELPFLVRRVLKLKYKPKTMNILFNWTTD